jgi:S-adenosylmethionine:tRNA ribosyltransferase-isomerase
MAAQQDACRPGAGGPPTIHRLLPMPLTLDDFDYPLPPELIAQHPAAARSDSRLLAVSGKGLADRLFVELPALLAPGDLLVVNDTRVIKARFLGEKDTGGRIEALIERIIDGRRALAQLRASKSPRPGSLLRLEQHLDVSVGARDGEFFLLELAAGGEITDWWTACERHGRLPLPPYINHVADEGDEHRYQTVYACSPGAVAAPTAGLHFDDALFAALAQAGIGRAAVTLHVGAGTFQPVRVQDLDLHRMHREHYEIPPATAAAIAAARRRGGRIVAVGTTTLRALESATPAAADTPQAGAGDTALFIRPGYRFRCVDRLITNFHLPKSTLLMLVSAFAGFERMRAAYAHAIAGRYRFFSYGDAMLLDRSDDEV